MNDEEKAEEEYVEFSRGFPRRPEVYEASEVDDERDALRNKLEEFKNDATKTIQNR